MSEQASGSYLLNGDDIKRLAGDKTKIIEYPELEKYQSIDALFGNDNAVIILYLADKTPYSATGHWVCLTRDPSKHAVNFFCSYGLLPDSSIYWIKSKKERERLNQDIPLLTKMLLDYSKGGGKVHYNERQLQARDPDVATCGRFVGLRARFNQLSTNEFQKMLLDYRNKGWNLDDLVTELSNKILRWS